MMSNSEITVTFDRATYCDPWPGKNNAIGSGACPEKSCENSVQLTPKTTKIGLEEVQNQQIRQKPNQREAQQITPGTAEFGKNHISDAFARGERPWPASFLGPTCVGGGGGALSVLSAKSLSLSLMLTSNSFEKKENCNIKKQDYGCTGSSRGVYNFQHAKRSVHLSLISGVKK